MPEQDKSALTQRVKEILKNNGFDLVGIAPVDPKPQDVEFWKLWIVEKRHGEMGYMENPVRNSIKLWHPEAQSVIITALFYEGPHISVNAAKPEVLGNKNVQESRDQGLDFSDQERPAPSRRLGTYRAPEAQEATGRIASYARYPDYHKVIHKKLKRALAQIREIEPKADGKIFTDSSPILERSYAGLAGIGWIGKNTMMIHPKLGSYFFLGGMAINLDLDKDQERITSHCGTCTRCIDACPTQCLKPHQMDAQRCLAYLTIEKKTIAMEPDLMEKTGDWIFGCDICQEVCPYNRFSPVAKKLQRKEEYLAQSVVEKPKPSENNDGWKPIKEDRLSLKTILAWSKEDYQAYFAGTPVRRAKWDVFLRNTMIAAGNSGQRDLIKHLEVWEKTENPELTGVAQAGKKRLLTGPTAS